MRRHLISATLLAAVLGPAAARATEALEGWTFAVSPYAWLPGLSTSVGTPQGTVDVDMSTSDVVSDLNFAFMGAAEARKGKWGLIADFIYSDISSSEPTPLGLLWDKATADTRLSALTVYAGYRVFEDERAAVDVLAGGRFYWLNVDFALTPNRARGLEYNLNDDWADPVFGLRGRYNFNENWFATALGDLGGFAGDDNSWQVFGSVGYQFNPTWSVQAGWRYMDVEKTVSGTDLAIGLNGPMIGFTGRF